MEISEKQLAELDSLETLNDDQLIEKSILQNVIHKHYESSVEGAQIRAKIDCLKSGEMNYKFIHSIERYRQRNNALTSLMNEKNETFHSSKDILGEIANSIQIFFLQKE